MTQDMNTLTDGRQKASDLLVKATPLREEIYRRILYLIDEYGDDALAKTSPEELAEYIAEYPAPLAVNAYEPLVKALEQIAYLGTDAPAFGGDPSDFYRDQLWRAIGTAARALATVESPEREGGE